MRWKADDSGGGGDVCTADVAPEAETLLASLLTDIAEALWPGRGDEVLIGPVDFGGEP
jgi:hypothetical protein